MKKTLLVFYFLVLFSGIITAQENLHSFDETYPNLLDRSLVSRDTLNLNQLLHRDLTLGHSNGWIENKKDLLETLMNEGVVYNTIHAIGSPQITHQSGNLITTRRDIDVEGVVNTTAFSVKLNLLEVWTCENGHWQLLARQSVNRK